LTISRLVNQSSGYYSSILDGQLTGQQKVFGIGKVHNHKLTEEQSRHRFTPAARALTQIPQNQELLEAISSAGWAALDPSE
jgi:hypothetical protein